jgi:membrane protein implicated in regulation of membrane protease activity
MNLLLGLPFLVLVWGLLLPLVFLDGAGAYLGLLWKNPRLVVVLVLNLGVLSYWLGRRLSQALLLRSTGAKLRATHEPS